MIIKCECHHCQGGLEFEAENAGQSVTCPHCGQLTVLALPVAKLNQKRTAAGPSKLLPCRHCGAWVARKAHDCPNCGGPTPEKPSVFYYVFVGVVSLIVTGIIIAVVLFAIGAAFGVAAGR